MSEDLQTETCITTESSHPKERAPQHLWDDWNVFRAEIEKRLQKGYEEYGDKSFEMHPLEIFEEWEQEFFDILGWGFILWKRMQKLKQHLTDK